MSNIAFLLGKSLSILLVLKRRHQKCFFFSSSIPVLFPITSTWSICWWTSSAVLDLWDITFLSLEASIFFHVRACIHTFSLFSRSRPRPSKKKGRFSHWTVLLEKDKREIVPSDKARSDRGALLCLKLFNRLVFFLCGFFTRVACFVGRIWLRDGDLVEIISPILCDVPAASSFDTEKGKPLRNLIMLHFFNQSSRITKALLFLTLITN